MENGLELLIDVSSGLPLEGFIANSESDGAVVKQVKSGFDGKSVLTEGCILAIIIHTLLDGCNAAAIITFPWSLWFSMSLSFFL